MLRGESHETMVWSTAEAAHRFQPWEPQGRK